MPRVFVRDRAAFAMVLAAWLAWPVPGPAQSPATPAQPRGFVPPGGLAPLQPEPGDAWSEVRSWQAPRPRATARPPAAAPPRRPPARTARPAR